VRVERVRIAALGAASVLLLRLRRLQRWAQRVCQMRQAGTWMGSG
jgi:hypothetical protein